MIPALTSFHLGPLGLADLIAVFLLVCAWLVIGRLTEHPPVHRPSVSKLMESYRREWMRQLVTRTPRLFDGQMVDGLRQSTTFFASTSLIAIGGGMALIGNPQQVSSLVAELAISSTDTPRMLWEVRILTAILFGANALLKFIWSHRLFSYAAIAMAAVPNDITNPLAYPRAAQAARLNINAAKSFNRGLRSVSFALASLAWLLGPYALMAATATTTWILWRREFASTARKAILENPPE